MLDEHGLCLNSDAFRNHSKSQIAAELVCWQKHAKTRTRDCSHVAC